MSRSGSAGYAQFLLKTLLKRSARTHELRAIARILAVCTIVVRPLHAAASHAQATLGFLLRSIMRRTRASSERRLYFRNSIFPGPLLCRPLHERTFHRGTRS